MVIEFRKKAADPVIRESLTTERLDKPKRLSDREKAENELVRSLAFEEPVKRGRGRPASGKETVTLRVDAGTVAFFKTYGSEWREAMSDALDKAANP